MAVKSRLFIVGAVALGFASSCASADHAGTTPFAVSAIVRSYSAAHLPLHEEGVFHWGSAAKVRYLTYAKKPSVVVTPSGGLRTSDGFSFTVLVFSNSAQAREATSAPSVVKALRHAHTPFVRRNNLVLAARVPVADWRGIWMRATQALREVKE
jgi:hypothetical protein